jgi:hypothetical protein
MQRQSIIVLINGNQVEAWGSLKEACTKHGWSYSTIVQKKLPTEWKGWQIHRCSFRALYVQEGGEK